LIALKGGDGVYNAAALKRVLEGEKNAYRDIALLNAAGALVVAGKACRPERRARQAAQSIDSGAALAALDKLVSVSQAHAPAPKAG
jgi:anthranilate phosphoribosyltransferase